MGRLTFSPSARQDLSDIFDYIARDKPVAATNWIDKAATNWIDKIEANCEQIAATPGFGEQRPEYGEDIRSSTVGRYVLFFRPIDEGIEVVRVIAGGRDIRIL